MAHSRSPSAYDDDHSHDGVEPPRKRRRQSPDRTTPVAPASGLEINEDDQGEHQYSEEWIQNPGERRRSETASQSTPTPTTASTLYRQPACQRCRSKKIKCDALSPQCTACKRAGEICTIANPTSHQEYQRGYVESLEDRIQQLQSYLQSVDGSDVNPEDDGARTTSSANVAPKPGILRQPPSSTTVELDGTNRPAKVPLTVPYPRRDPRYLGEGSGISFINSILAAIRTRQTDINLLKSLLSNKKKAALKASSTTKSQFQQQQMTPPRPPSVGLGSQLLATYLKKAQVKHPFVARSEVIRVCEGVLGLNTQCPPSSLQPQDHFRAFMVFAIASVFHYRNGDSSKENVNPMKYYAAAMQYIDSIPRLQNIDGVTNLLFIARLGFFCATGLSLWYISNLCLRICIENEMHINPSRSRFTKPMPAFEEQMRRRVFWQCYSLDRHASQTLGRPFGIADEDVKVDLPVDVDDEELKKTTADLTTFMAVRSNNSTNMTYPSSEMAAFLHNIQAKMITSRLNSELYRQAARRSSSPLSVMTTPGNLYMFLEKYINELVEWRSLAPLSAPPAVQPTSQGFYTEEWHDLHYYQEKLTLVRAIIDQIPAHNGYPPADLLDMCFDSACHIIKLYQKISASGEIEPARGRLYRVFVAGISVLYCLLLTQMKSKEEGKGVEQGLLQKQKEVLKTCQGTLEYMAKPLIDDGSGLKYVRTFEVLCREVIRRVTNDGRPSAAAASTPKSRPAMHARHASIMDTDNTSQQSEFGGASPPSGYEKIHQTTQYGSEPSPHSVHSWPGISDFAAGEIGEWFSGEGVGDVFGASNTSLGGFGTTMTTGTAATTGLGGLMDGMGATGVTGGYDYDIEGLGAEWANFLEILMDGRPS